MIYLLWWRCPVCGEEISEAKRGRFARFAESRSVRWAALGSDIGMHCHKVPVERLILTFASEVCWLESSHE